MKTKLVKSVHCRSNVTWCLQLDTFSLDWTEKWNEVLLARVHYWFDVSLDDKWYVSLCKEKSTGTESWLEVFDTAIAIDHSSELAFL